MAAGGSLRAALSGAGASPGLRKKRLTARCRWHFGGGPDYCSACARECEACPYREHEPLTQEGWEAWDVMLRCAGQLRLVPGAVIGLDLGACLGVGEALGYNAVALAELLPAAEAGMVAALNERLAVDSRNPLSSD